MQNVSSNYGYSIILTKRWILAGQTILLSFANNNNFHHVFFFNLW